LCQRWQLMARGRSAVAAFGNRPLLRDLPMT
jgi:hypothetical protein